MYNYFNVFDEVHYIIYLQVSVLQFTIGKNWEKYKTFSFLHFTCCTKQLCVKFLSVEWLSLKVRWWDLKTYSMLEQNLIFLGLKKGLILIIIFIRVNALFCTDATSIDKWFFRQMQILPLYFIPLCTFEY